MTKPHITTALQKRMVKRSVLTLLAAFLTAVFLVALGYAAPSAVSKKDSLDVYEYLKCLETGHLGDSEDAVIRGQIDYSQDVFVHGKGNSVESVPTDDSRLSLITRPKTSYSRFSLSDSKSSDNSAPKTEDEEEDVLEDDADTISFISAPSSVPRLDSEADSASADSRVADFGEDDVLSGSDLSGISTSTISAPKNPQTPSFLSSSSDLGTDTQDNFEFFDTLPVESSSSVPLETGVQDSSDSRFTDDALFFGQTAGTGAGSSVSENSVYFAEDLSLAESVAPQTQNDSIQENSPSSFEKPKTSQSASILEYDYGDFVDLDTLESSVNSGKSSSLLDSETSNQPPEESEFPEFAKNAYDALEPSDQELTAVVNEKKSTPERERKSISEKEKEEEELKAEYAEWLKKQKSDQKEKEKLPLYLQPLGDDHAVFDGPDSPYSRDRDKVPEQDHSFVREISAADLNLMSSVSSNRELMDWEKEQDMPVDWSKYSATALYNKWRDYLGMGPNEKEALAIMKKATLTMMEYEKEKNVKKLREAAELFENAGKKWPDSVLEEDALFYAAECYFFDNNYTKAKTSYKALLNKYSNSVLRRDAMERLYCIGVYWVKCAEEDPEIIGRFEGKERPRFSDFAGAKDAFEAIFTNDVSDKGRGPDAVFALANAYMRRGVEQGDASFDEAAKYYQRLYEFYPACKYADKAYQLAMLALYQSYRGPFYDSTPLKKAEEIAKTAQRAHKGDPDVIAEQLRLIKEKQAEYLLVRGGYYEKKKLYASARSYYNQLVTEYPESEYAAEAAERYGKIRENPAESDQFALIRPIVPFLPESKNQYFEDAPSDQMAASGAVQNGTVAERDNLIHPDYTELEKTADSGKPSGSGGEVR